MPYDKNGEPLMVGDFVNIRAQVIAVHSGAAYCNLTVETVDGMKETVSLNAAVVSKVPINILPAGQPVQNPL